ncbi:MAG: polysaccharide deacetylase family protein [Clostridiaceae bacterium]|nr:polysaccharide deacetylase family protein [Clostridiaceae bacterium]
MPTTTASADPYTVYPNTDLSWWYIPPKPLNQQLPAKIDPGIAALIAKYSTLWQLPSGSKKIYITMDEGYEFETNTAEILDIAKAKNIPITFFITGSYLNHNLPLVKRMLAEGHQVANHSFNHLRPAPALAISTDYYIADIQSLASRFRELTGSEIAPFYRPPEGGYSERALKIVEDLGYTTVFWSFAYRDWLTDAQPDITAAFDRISGELHDGSILLLHAVSDTNVAVLAQLIDFVRAQGYVIAPLPR